MDCDAAFEHIRASGAEVVQEPAGQPYGVRDCAFHDPAGAMLHFARRRTGRARRRPATATAGVALRPPPARQMETR